MDPVKDRGSVHIKSKTCEAQSVNLRYEILVVTSSRDQIGQGPAIASCKTQCSRRPGGVLVLALHTVAEQTCQIAFSQDCPVRPPMICGKSLQIWNPRIIPLALTYRMITE